MKWLIGLDMGHPNEGAVAWARWIKRQAKDDEVIAVRVLPPMGGPGGGANTSAADDEAGALLAEALRPFRDQGLFSEVAVETGAPVADRLASACTARGCDALVVGRRAPVRADRLIRLGKVARHLAAQLPCPVVVVPPNLKADEITNGPVMVAIDFSDSCKAAVTWGVALAKGLGRGVKLAHVTHVPELGFAIPDELRQSIEAGADAKDKVEFERWVEAEGLSDLERVQVKGSIAPALMSAAKQHDACVLVAGSRQLSGLERVFISPVGSDLAANAARPVALVPPG